MKRILHISFFVILLISAFTVSAQKGMKYTLFVLPQSVTMRNADDRALQELDNDQFRYAHLWGIGAGAYVGYNPSENFGLRTGLLYSHQGYKYTAKSTYYERNRFVTRLDYLKMPLMMGVSSNYMDNKAVFSFYGGFQFGWLLGGQMYDDVTEYVPAPDPNISRHPALRTIYSRMNNSLVAETGLDITLTEDFALNLKLRGDYSLADAENKDATYRVTQNGQTQYVKYWEAGRLKTHNLTGGLLVGLTYNIIPEVKYRKPTPEKIRKEKAPNPKAEEKKEEKTEEKK
ncbi:MAG: PorT family protein [Bacteroidia bacterium]|nr:PorT family protein [Bacteroidia bacterium]